MGNIYADRDRPISRSEAEHLQYFIRLVIQVSRLVYYFVHLSLVLWSNLTSWASCSLRFFGGVSLPGDQTTITESYSIEKNEQSESGLKARDV